MSSFGFEYGDKSLKDLIVRPRVTSLGEADLTNCENVLEGSSSWIFLQPLKKDYSVLEGHHV